MVGDFFGCWRAVGIASRGCGSLYHLCLDVKLGALPAIIKRSYVFLMLLQAAPIGDENKGIYY
jgi:hypothetical protein